MTKISTVEAKAKFSEIINRAAYGKERLIVSRRGKDLAAVVPVEDIRRLEELEDLLDLRDAEKSLNKFRKSKERAIPFDKILRERKI